MYLPDKSRLAEELPDKARLHVAQRYSLYAQAMVLAIETSLYVLEIYIFCFLTNI